MQNDPTGRPESQLRAFFDEFVVAFATFDGSEIAQRYHEPYLALHADGRAETFASRSGIGSYFQQIVDRYRQLGCRSCRYSDLSFVELGSDAILATVTWDLLDENGASVTCWRESYNLYRSGNRYTVVASTDHLEANRS